LSASALLRKRWVLPEVCPGTVLGPDVAGEIVEMGIDVLGVHPVRRSGSRQQAHGGADGET
jgi:hypothetical protein